MKNADALCGQSLGEYSFLLALVIVAVIGALQLLGGNLSHVFTGIHTGIAGTSAILAKASQTSGASVAASQAGAKTAGTAPLSTATAAPPASVSGLSETLGLRLANGQNIQIDGYPANLAKSIQTVGANGATEQLLASLESVIQDLKAQGDLTPAQETTLDQLANQGHQIANIEKAQEDIVNQDLQTGNITLPIQKVSDSIGFNGGNDQDGADAAQFRQLYQQAVSEGALNDPVAKQTVDTLVNQIGNLADGVESSVASINFGVTPVNQFVPFSISAMTNRDVALGQHTQQTLVDMGASVITHRDSAGICTTGNGRDSGVHCAP